MPIEIRELVIRAVVDQRGMPGAGGDDADAPGGAEAMSATASGNESIVQECVRQVMRILARERER